MALRYNSITVIGRATRDAELRFTQDGTPMTTFSVAYNHPVRNQQGGWDDEATFFNAICFGDQAQRAADRIKRGVVVLVEGRMRMRKYTAQDGTERQSWEIVANVVRPDASGAPGQGGGDDMGDSDMAAPAPARAQQPQRQNFGGRGSQRNAPPSDDVDDLPF